MDLNVREQMPFFINADLEITAKEDLSCILAEWGDAVVEMCCCWRDDENFFASFELSVDCEVTDPEPLIHRFCELVSALSPRSKQAWDKASRRVIDLGCQTDDGSRVVRATLSGEVLSRMAALGIELALTVYPLEGKLSK